MLITLSTPPVGFGRLFMKRILFVLLAVLVVAVSCSDFAGSDNLASVKFGRLEAKGDSTVAGELAAVNNLYWKYKATKADTGSTVGQTDFKALGSGKGVDYQIGGMAPGAWKFQIEGYLESSYTNKIYSSAEATATLVGGQTATVPFTVEIVDGSKGNLKTVKPASVMGTSNYTVTCTGVYQGTGTVSNITPATDGSIVGNIKQGLWKLTYSFKDNANNNLGSCDVTALILNGATTTVTLSYDGQTASFKAGTVTTPTISDWTKNRT